MKKKKKRSFETAREVEAGHLGGFAQRRNRTEDERRAARTSVWKRRAAGILRTDHRQLWTAGKRSRSAVKSPRMV